MMMNRRPWAAVAGVDCYRRRVPRRPAKRTPLPIAYTSGITRPLKTAEATARDIVRDIVAAGLQQGDKLLAEPEMLAHHGVSRQSLREALRLLEVQGLIELHRGPGGGPVVGSVDAANFGRMGTLYYHLVGVTYAEIVEAWAFAEGQIAWLVAGRDDRPCVDAASPDDVGPDDVGPDDAGPDGDLAAYVDRHSRFHYVLAQQCGNRALQLALSSYGMIAAHHLLAELDPRLFGDVIEAQHREIASAIAAGDRELARDLSEAHVHTIAELYQRATGASLDTLVEWR